MRKRGVRGLASVDPEERSRIGRMGGKASWKAKKAHKFTSEEAKIAGRKGGKSTARKRAGAKPIFGM